MLYDWSMESNYITSQWRRISQGEIRNWAAAESGAASAPLSFPQQCNFTTKLEHILSKIRKNC
jgi:hypothetical protein